MLPRIKTFFKDIGIFLAFFFLLAIIMTFATTYTKDASTLMFIETIGTCFLTGLLIIYFKKEFLPFKKAQKINIKKYLAIYVITNILVIIINNILINTIGSIAANEEANRQMINEFPILSTFSICILAPIYEEILVRSNFKNLFKSKWSFTLTTGIFFGSLHLLVAHSPLELLYIIPYSLLGCMLSYIYYDGSIYSSILIHALNNTIQIILLLGGIQ